MGALVREHAFDLTLRRGSRADGAWVTGWRRTVVRRDGVVSYGDEGFGKSYPDTVRRKILARINPGFGKARPKVPSGISDIKEHEVYGGLAYLVVGRKA
ncbi:MAG: hypothetical protein WBV96_18255 [Polyangia bacterium]